MLLRNAFIASSNLLTIKANSNQICNTLSLDKKCLMSTEQQKHYSVKNFDGKLFGKIRKQNSWHPVEAKPVQMYSLYTGQFSPWVVSLSNPAML